MKNRGRQFRTRATLYSFFRSKLKIKWIAADFQKSFEGYRLPQATANGKRNLRQQASLGAMARKLIIH